MISGMIPIIGINPIMQLFIARRRRAFLVGVQQAAAASRSSSKPQGSKRAKLTTLGPRGAAGCSPRADPGVPGRRTMRRRENPAGRRGAAPACQARAQRSAAPQLPPARADARGPGGRARRGARTHARTHARNPLHKISARSAGAELFSVAWSGFAASRCTGLHFVGFRLGRVVPSCVGWVVLVGVVRMCARRACRCAGGEYF